MSPKTTRRGFLAASASIVFGTSAASASEAVDGYKRERMTFTISDDTHNSWILINDGEALRISVQKDRLPTTAQIGDHVEVTNDRDEGIVAVDMETQITQAP